MEILKEKIDSMNIKCPNCKKRNVYLIAAGSNCGRRSLLFNYQCNCGYDSNNFYSKDEALAKLESDRKGEIMDIIKNNEELAHGFIESYGHDTPSTVGEFEAILSEFGTTSAQYALEWAARHILNSADASNEERTKEFAENMAMTLRSVAAQAITN